MSVDPSVLKRSEQLMATARLLVADCHDARQRAATALARAHEIMARQHDAAETREALMNGNAAPEPRSGAALF